VLHTNTFGALADAVSSGRERLDSVAAAARIARKAAGGTARVAGSLAAWDLKSRVPLLEDVLRVMLDEGVDLLVFESCNSVHDAQLALEARTEYASRLPAVISLSSTDGTRADHKRLDEAAAFLLGSDTGVELGLNCCRGPNEAFKLALSFPVAPRWCKPSCGNPEDPVDDNVMAAFARAARLRGVRFLGGCCGTGPETLLVMAAALDSLPP
jgi:methionine synthase / methylenetetrahydrofolate reductase(NADPH)